MSIRDLVKKSEKTQEEIANALGVHQTLVSLWVCGKCKPNIADLPKIANVLGCSIEDIVSSVAR